MGNDCQDPAVGPLRAIAALVQLPRLVPRVASSMAALTWHLGQKLRASQSATCVAQETSIEASKGFP